MKKPEKRSGGIRNAWAVGSNPSGGSNQIPAILFSDRLLHRKPQSSTGSHRPVFYRLPIIRSSRTGLKEKMRLFPQVKNRPVSIYVFLHCNIHFLYYFKIIPHVHNRW